MARLPPAPPRLVALPAPGPSLTIEDRVRAFLVAQGEAEARLHLELLATAPGPARAHLLAAIREGTAETDDDARLAGAFSRLGWAGVARALEALVGDKDLPRRVRELALRLLARRDSERGRTPGVDEGDVLGAEFIAGVVGAADGGAQLLDFLELSPAEVRGQTIALLDEVRRAERIPASLLWGEAAKAAWVVEEHPEIVDTLVEEASAEAEEALQAARELARGRHRRGLDAALLRIRTARIEPEVDELPADASARVSACDGSGAFQVLVAFPSRAGRWTALGVCIRAGADVRDGGLFFDLDEEARDTFLEEFCTAAGLPAVDTPVALAAAVVEAAVERTRAAGRALPGEVAPAIRVLGSLVRDRQSPAIPEAGPVPTLAAVRALLREESYASWRFDAADLRSFQADDPPPPRPVAHRRAWARAASVRVAGTRAARRLTAACQHQAWWHAHAGDSARAALFARLAADLERSTEGHPLILALLERAHVGDTSQSVALDIGDEGTRSLLRFALGDASVRPKGRDLAWLDLAEVSIVALDAAFARVDVGQRPRADEMLALAVDIAERAVSAEASGAGGGVVARWLAAHLVTQGHTAEEAGVIGDLVAGAHEGFLRTVCPECPVGCWGRLGKPMARVWRAPGHPAMTTGPVRGRGRRPVR